MMQTTVKHDILHHLFENFARFTLLNLFEGNSGQPKSVVISSRTQLLRVSIKQDYNHIGQPVKFSSTKSIDAR